MLISVLKITSPAQHPHLAVQRPACHAQKHHPPAAEIPSYAMLPKPEACMILRVAAAGREEFSIEAATTKSAKKHGKVPWLKRQTSKA